MADVLTYSPGFPDWRQAHGYAQGLAVGPPIGLVVTCPAGQTRSELQSPWDAMEGDDHWYGVTVQLPQGFTGSASDWCVLAQAHEDGVAKPPPWSVVAKSTGLRLEMRHQNGMREIRDLGPLPVAAPARIAVHCVSTVAVGGRVEAFRDGVSSGVVTGSTRYTTKYPVRPRVGVYRGHSTGTQVAWFGPLVRGDSLADVSPRDCTGQEREVKDAADALRVASDEKDVAAAAVLAATDREQAAADRLAAAHAALDDCRGG